MIRQAEINSPRFIASSMFRILLILAVIASFFTVLVSPVQAQPIIFPSTLPDGQVNASYTATLVAAPLTCPCSWVITSGALPPGLALSPTSGSISGTPSAAGIYPFFVTVTDNTTLTSPQQGFSITIAQPPLTIVTSSMPQGKEGTSYSVSLTATGGTYPYNWTILSGTLPSGLSLSATTGVITGAPAIGTAGSSSFIVGVTDSSTPAISGQKSFTIYIEEGIYSPTISIGSGLEAGSTKVYVQGTQVTSLTGGDSTSINVALGVGVTVAVEPTVSHPSEEGVRFKAEETETVVNELNPNAIFNYYTEYEVSMVTKPSQIIQISGSGWYEEDDMLNTSADKEVEGDEKGVLYRFSHWTLPTGGEIENQNLGITVDKPLIITASYDEYYLLTLESDYGDVEGGGWYQADSNANWRVVDEAVPIPGILGFFQGKLRPAGQRGTVAMDAPKTITVFWEPDYTMPFILIPVAILIAILIVAGIILLLYRAGTRPPAPAPTPVYPHVQQPRPVPTQHTTVVMLGDKQQKQLPQTTKEQLVEQFSQLLDKYETELKATMDTKGLPTVETAQEDRMLSGPVVIPSDVVDGEVIHTGDSTDQSCDSASKKLLRTVVTQWRKIGSSRAKEPATMEEELTGKTGQMVNWARDIYQEWEITTCYLKANHKGSHKGDTEILYTLLNTVTEKKAASSRQKAQPPSPHYTDGMPETQINDDQVISTDDLPNVTAA
ncbi:Ig domain-containing protein [Chloroflexota bacterium]